MRQVEVEQELLDVDDGDKKPEEERCEFCGAKFAELHLSTSRKQRGKFCSRTCQRRAARRRINARLAMPPSKRYAKSLKYSNELYFN